MRHSDDRRLPLWMEREQEQYGHTLTPHEHLLEELDQRPSFLLPAGADRALPKNEEQS